MRSLRSPRGGVVATTCKRRPELSLALNPLPIAFGSPSATPTLRKMPTTPAPLPLGLLRPPTQTPTPTSRNKLKLPSLTALKTNFSHSSTTPLARASQDTPSRAQTELKAKFEFLGKLQSAIFGSVVKARRRADDELVAIKILQMDLVRKKISVKETPVCENAFVELTVLQKAAEQPHPNVLHSLPATGSKADILHDDRNVYCITPFCDKGELFQAIQKSKGLPIPEATRLFKQVADGVHHLHSVLGYVHNDISPENILLKSGKFAQEKAVLMDFGLATKIGRPAPRVHGKPAYQAPEVLFANEDRRQSAHAWSDVYSLGVLFFVMLTGVLPYDRPQADECDKYAAMTRGAECFGRIISQWDNPACFKLATGHSELLELICQMVREEPQRRPTLNAVVATLVRLGYLPRNTSVNKTQRMNRRHRSKLGTSIKCLSGTSKFSHRQSGLHSIGNEADLDSNGTENYNISHGSGCELGATARGACKESRCMWPAVVHHSLRDQDRGCRRRRLLLPSPRPTLDLVSTSPSGVADLTFLRRDLREFHIRPGTSDSAISINSACSSGSNNVNDHFRQRQRQSDGRIKCAGTHSQCKD